MTGINTGGLYGYSGNAGRPGANPMGYGAAPRRVGAPPQQPGFAPQATAPQPPAYQQPTYEQPQYQQPQYQQPAYQQPTYEQPGNHAQPDPYAPQAQTDYQAYDNQAAQGYSDAPDYTAYSTAPVPDDGQGGGAVNWIGALCSLALVLGLGVWGYQTIQRDVSGVPVIQALPGPMRIQPENPGGSQASHQGLSVNSVQAQGRTGDMPDQIVLAPRALDLSAEGITAAPLPAPSSSQNGSAASLTVPQSNLTEAEQTAAYAALADQIAAGVPTLDGSFVTSPTPDGGNVTLSILPASAPGLARSPRPVARPALLRTASVASAVAPQATAAPAGPFVDAASIPSGTRLVQFGAYDSPEIAQSEWQRISAQFSDFMDGKRPVVQQAFSGGREFHRLRVLGFADVSEARRFCSVFLAENAPCIPVVAK